MPLRTSLIALALAIGAILPIRSDHARTRDTLPPDLVRAIEAFDRAQVAADTATLARLVTDDYVLVNSDASVDRKQKYLADFLLPGLRMEPYMIEQRIEKTWGDAAVVFGLQRLSWTQDGQRHQRVLRIVHVWTKRNGRWQATHTQLTRVQQVQTLKDHHVADVEELRSKFVALAEVFPEDYYNWRPMEGTRSVRDVLILVAAEANIFPAYWGLPAVEGAAQNYRAESDSQPVAVAYEGNDHLGLDMEYLFN